MMRSALLLVSSLAAVGASAASPLGTWTGKFQIKNPPIPASATPAQKVAMAKAIAALNAAKIVLVLKADKTYSTKMVGMPGGGTADTGGTWSQTGSAVTLNAKKGTTGVPVNKLDLSKDGKTMTLLIPNGRGKVVFTR